MKGNHLQGLAEPFLKRFDVSVTVRLAYFMLHFVDCTNPGLLKSAMWTGWR